MEIQQHDGVVVEVAGFQQGFAKRCGSKGPDNVAALAKILSELFKGEEEEFTRIKPRDGFSMYNPPSWVSYISLLPFFPHYLS